MISFRLIVVVLLLFGLGGMAGSGQVSANNLLDKPIDQGFANTTMLFVVSTLANEYDVPIGLERTSDYQRKMLEQMSLVDGKIIWKESNMNLEPGSLRSVLDALVKHEPQYVWEFRDGVINIVPVKDRDEVLGQLLELKIVKFDPPSTTDKFKIRDAILDLPELNDFLSRNNVEALKRYYLYKRGIRRVDDADLTASNLTVREILNKVVRESEHKVWVVDRVGDKKEYFTLGF